MIQYYLDAITKHYFDFNGRARRAAFWYFVLVNIIISIILGVIQSMAHLGNILSGVYSLAILLPSLGLYARRLHDIGKSGWWFLIAFTGIGVFVLIYWWVQAGTVGPNEYGADPKAA